MSAQTDRELLELAAKAADIELQRCRLDDPLHRDFLLLERSPDENAIGWNPLTDDGDALRLAVKLQISVLQLGATRLCEDATGAYLADEVDAESDGLAATRRAIVRAAATLTQGA